MRSCPHCSEQILDTADECRHCGRALEPTLAQTEPGPQDLAKLAEIRRLQRIAGGQPTRQDSLRQAKGWMALLIIVVILVYAYVWKQGRSAEFADRSTITYRTFNASFGQQSPLTETTKAEEFENYKDLQVVWEGTVAYVNRGTGRELYVSVRHRSDSPTSDVLVRIPESRRGMLNDLPEGVRIRYSGHLRDYGADGTGFITLYDGRILARQGAPNP